MKSVLNLSNEIAQVLEVLVEEVRTPITSILFNLQSIKRMLNNEEEFSREMLLEKTDIIEVKINHMSRVLDELIDLAKSQISEIKMKFNLTNTHDLIADVLDKSKLIIEKSPVKIEHQNSNDFCNVACDRDRMVQAISDIIGNIIHINSKTKTVKLSSKTTDQYALLKIQDEDNTIDKSYLSKVFEKFFKGGMGINKEKIHLGLALAKSIIEAHHGKLWVESKAGLGTAFFIELPKMELSDLKAASMA